MKDIEILKELKEVLSRSFGDKIDRVILFGSRCKGTGHTYSDYDILIILSTDYDWMMEDNILNICYDIDLKYDLLS